MALKVTSLTDLGPFMMNAYLLTCSETGEMIVIDPGDEGNKINNQIDTSGASVVSIYLTHAHLDHVRALPEVQQHCNTNIFLPKWEIEIYENVAFQCRLFGLPEIELVQAYEVFDESHTLKCGKHSAAVLHTPGHSPGSCCFYFESSRILVAGDLLFKDSIGRMDLWGANVIDMKKSLTKILSLPDDVVVYPGHGPQTTIARERGKNPFLLEIIHQGTLTGV